MDEMTESQEEATRIIEAIGTIKINMTSEEYIKNEYGESWLKNDWSSWDVQDALAEYGKHCAEQAWREAERNMLRSVRVITFESWWSEFQRKEATE